MMPIAQVQQYLDKNYRLVFWPQIGDDKGPKGAAGKGWTERHYGIEDYKEGYRVGIMTGHELSPGKFIHDVDIDWAPGSVIATKLLPPTEFVFGRPSKKISHCFYTTPDPIRSYKYEDIDKSTLIELRGTKVNGELGVQSMCPPSVWTKDGKREELIFVRDGDPSHLDSSADFKQRVCLAAIGMLLAKHFGTNGFGHDPRLAWAGFMLRAGIPVEDIITMGEAISAYCNNTEIGDVRLTVESTHARMQAKEQKIKGGPSLAKLFGAHGKAIIARINEWLGRDSDFIRNHDGKILADNAENCRRALVMLNVEMSFDLFSNKMFVKREGKEPVPLEDNITTDLWFKVDEECRFRPTYAFFEKVLAHTAFNAAYHPVEQYLHGLEWDGKHRIDRWLTRYAGAEDSEYVRAVARIFLVAAVRRIRKPGSKYDEMLVLESKQGFEKSSALRALCPNEGWFSDDLPLNLDAKQIIEATLGKWIIEASDLAGKRKTEVEQLKSMLSRQVDGPARMAYAHFPVERPRHWVMVGTTNSQQYLTDSTGARRFWPVEVGRFNVEALRADRDQLWAEACVAEAKGESIRLSPSLWGVAGEEQEERREVDAWENLIVDMLHNVQPGLDERRRVVTDHIWDVLGIETARRDRHGAIRIAEIMQRLGYAPTTIRKASEPVKRGYLGPAGEKLVFGGEGE